MNGKQLIGTDPESSIAQLFCNRLQTADVFLETIEKNEVVAATMHLGEGNFHLAYSFEFLNPLAYGPPPLQRRLMGDFCPADRWLPTSSLEDRRDDFAPDQIIEVFSRPDYIVFIAVHQNLRRLRMRIVVRCHGKPVSPRAHNRQ